MASASRNQLRPAARVACIVLAIALLVFSPLVALVAWSPTVSLDVGNVQVIAGPSPDGILLPPRAELLLINPLTNESGVIRVPTWKGIYIIVWRRPVS